MRTIIVLILTVTSLTACGGNGAGSGGTEVAAPVYPLAYAAEEIAGDAAEVANLTPPGAEPHDVELSVRDVETVRSADLVLLLGAEFQPALADAAAEADGEVLDLLESVEVIEGQEGVDPHAWLDPLRFATMAERIGAALDREQAAARLAERLRALDAELARGLADCRRREIVTSHAAFGYLAERYGLEQIAISGLAPEAEPAAGDLEELVEAVRRTGGTTVFVEPLVNPRLAETVAREAGVEVATLNPLEGLTEQELETGADYFSVMRENLAALREVLECR
ncbi:MAG TPA: zinc ABC transporter substrate-binding protein [Gaiellaceae bacterium]|jgi:zinc transport system substrate-binding protein|nr:zinc ABC transporter substrate-binding protein [Gaiellaceae bacterium]